MNGKKARLVRKGDALPDGTGATMTEERRLQAWADAEYMAARGLRNEQVPPPAHWSSEWVAAFEANIATPEGRSALLNFALEGVKQNRLADME